MHGTIYDAVNHFMVVYRCEQTKKSMERVITNTQLDRFSHLHRVW